MKEKERKKDRTKESLLRKRQVQKHTVQDRAVRIHGAEMPQYGKVQYGNTHFSLTPKIFHKLRRSVSTERPFRRSGMRRNSSRKEWFKLTLETFKSGGVKSSGSDWLYACLSACALAY